MNSWKQTAGARARLANESGAVHKEHGGRLAIALTYPNTYYVGMSSLALHILYRLFNQRPGVVCERVFWDPEAAAAGWPVASLESQTNVLDFAVWAFSISFEMDYFNVAAMLQQAGIPPLARDRADGSWPLLLAGGPAVTMNPEPLAPFFDVVVLGEGEETAAAMAEIMQDELGGERERLLDLLGGLPGIYLPGRVEPRPGAQPIARQWVRDVGALRPTSALYTPDTEFAGMHLVEIARGCGRGCRYCLAGYVYRPVREQPLAQILDWAQQALAEAPAAGGRTPGIGLVSAAVSDHSQIGALAEALRGMGARVSVSSMRTDPISLPLVQAMAESGTQTLTIAPEAGSERLRTAINKPQQEADLLAAVELAQALGFPQLKMYYMIGHPTEDESDIQGIVDLTLQARAMFKRRVAINATPFVPKAHTPFQWEAMMPVKVIQARQAMLQRALRKHQVEVRADSPQWAMVQAVLARGDRRLAPVLLECSRPSIRGFEQALARHGLDIEAYTGARSPGAYLPWQIVDGGVSEAFLVREQRLAHEDRAGRRCPPQSAGCLACQACDPAFAFRFTGGRPAKSAPRELAA